MQWCAVCKDRRALNTVLCCVSCSLSHSFGPPFFVVVFIISRSLIFFNLTQTEERKTYHTDFIRYHLNYVSEKPPDRLCRLVSEGKIIAYLDDFEQRVSAAIDSQVELWKQNDEEYQTAVLSGDVKKQIGLENCFVYMAREAVFECMVYI